MSETQLHGHIVLCGLDSLGVRTLEELDRLGEDVVVVAPHLASRWRDESHGVARSIIQGDQRDPDVLREAGVGHAKAIVLTEDDDVGNIHAALLAHEINPHIHAVVRTFDEEFGRRVESLLPDAVALSASALAAPGFVTAILDEDADERWIEVLGRTLALRHLDASDPSVVVPLADDAVTPVVLFPRTGAHVLCLADAAGHEARVKSVEPTRRTMPLPRRGLMRAVRRVDKRFWVLGAVLVGITAMAAAIFALFAHIDLLIAVSQAVGAFFGGVSPDAAQDSAGLRIFAIVLTLFGAAALALFYGLIADVVLSTRISNLLGPQATDARDHVIVVGLGTIGFRIAMLLRERGITVVAAEKEADGRFVEAARELRIPVVTTDARSGQILKALGIEQARALVATTDDDAANLATALHARTARPDMRIVLRLFDPDLAAHLDQALGDYNSRSVSTLAAPAFAAAAVGRHVQATVAVGLKRVLIIVRVPIEAGSAADGSTVAAEEDAATNIELGGCRVLALVVGDEVRWRPTPADVVAGGMEMLVVATKRGLATELRRGASEVRVAAERHVPVEGDEEVEEGAAPGSEADLAMDVSRSAS